MTETQAAPKMSLADALAKVQVSAGDAALILDALAGGYADKSPTLHAALHEAIGELTSGTTTTTEETSSSNY